MEANTLLPRVPRTTAGDGQATTVSVRTMTQPDYNRPIPNVSRSIARFTRVCRGDTCKSRGGVSHGAGSRSDDLRVADAMRPELLQVGYPRMPRLCGSFRYHLSMVAPVRMVHTHGATQNRHVVHGHAAHVHATSAMRIAVDGTVTAKVRVIIDRPVPQTYPMTWRPG